MNGLQTDARVLDADGVAKTGLYAAASTLIRFFGAIILRVVTASARR
jgi:hypothetical protein